MSTPTDNGAADERHRLPRVTGSEPDVALRGRMRHFYRDAAGYEDQLGDHGEAYFRAYVDVLSRYLPEPAGEILELGAGTGRALVGLVRQRPSICVTGLELSGRNLAAIRERGRPFTGVCGDALELPFAARSFDAVTCFQVIEHLPSIPRAIDEALRVLRRPGYLVIGAPNHASLWTPLQDLLRGRTRYAFGVVGRRSAARWLLQNTGIAIRKRLARRASYLYRAPDLGAHVRGGDRDAVYYACPLDLLRELADRGAVLVGSDATARWGRLGSFVPSEARGSMLAVWRVD